MGELSKAAGCNVETVRYYERIGLLPAPDRTQSGYRSYSEEHLERLQFIRHCRALQMSLATSALCCRSMPIRRRTAST
jgi:DNA-binding transcriptional MerR regulator